MTLFFFDVRDARGMTRDHVGQLLLDRETARGEALKALGEIASDMLITEGAAKLSIEVREELGGAFFRANSLTHSAWVD